MRLYQQAGGAPGGMPDFSAMGGEGGGFPGAGPAAGGARRPAPSAGGGAAKPSVRIEEVD